MTKNKLLNINGNTRIAGVTGLPISHSKSPKIHNFWLSENNIDGVYIPIHIQEGDFDHVVKSMSKIGMVGMNVTSPYKILAHNICDELTDCAKEVGAVNTLTFKENGKIHGDCTDAYGFYQALIHQDNNFTIKNEIALVMGAGGASRAIIWQLIHAGASKVILANRTISKAEDVVKSLHIKDKCQVISINDVENHLENIRLLVNTTTLGSTKEQDLHIDLKNLHKNAIVYDILYNPKETTLLKNAKEQGHVCLNGEGMLLHQAVPAFQRWFDILPEVSKELHQYIYESVELKTNKIIGLTGTIGSGKSTVSSILMSQGYSVFDADSNVHNLMNYNQDVMDSIYEKFGSDIFKNNKISREKLGKIVLNSSDKLRSLEEILYPHLIKNIERFTQDNTGLCFLDIPLLFEKNFDKFCHEVLVISINSQKQEQRVLKRPQMTKEKLTQFLSQQMPIQDKEKLSKYVIHNNGDLADLKKDLEEFIFTINTN